MSKSVVYLVLGVTMTIGSYIPTLFGQRIFSIWGIVGSIIGLVIGIYIVVKINS